MFNIVTELKRLKLNGMASSYAERLDQGRHTGTDAYDELIQHLIEAEITDRAVRSIGYQMSSARFPIHRCMADFDFSQAKVDKALIDQLATLGNPPIFSSGQK